MLNFSPIQCYRGANRPSYYPVIKSVITNNATVAVYTDTLNKRIRIDDYTGDLTEIRDIIQQQKFDWVEKLIVKSRAQDVPFFMAMGFSCEAFIKGYFAGTDMYFLTMYFSSARQRTEKWMEEESILQKLLSNKSDIEAPCVDEIKVATPAQAGELARLYNAVFKVYPTPLGDEAYIIKTMEEGTLYAYLESDHHIVSASSAEINWKFKNAELTDCATLPQTEGKGLMKRLLYFIEQRLKSDGIGCCYSIARAESFSMNRAFFQLGYSYGGRLIKNCLIYSGLEDMNVWYKKSHGEDF